jgi:hypothetical protein
MIFYTGAIFYFKKNRGNMEEDRALFSPIISHIVKLRQKNFLNLNSPNLKSVLFFISIVLYSYNIQAQTYSVQTGLDEHLKLVHDSFPVLDTTESESSAVIDSMPPPPKPRLLPENISFGEKLFWGENGIFRSIGIAGPLTPESRRSELTTRRFMLTAHQISGFTTVALMLATAYYGQKTIDNHFNRTYSDDHQKFVAATIAGYSLTALLSVLSPPPSIRRDDEESTTTLHKTLAWIHAAGMIITPILGSMIGGRKSFNADKAHFHQVAGYVTTAIFTTALIVVTF